MSGYRSGVVKWFNADKGYGFIQPDKGQGNEDVFVHYSGIAGSGFRALQDGDLVDYMLEESKTKPGKMLAVEVQVKSV